MESIRPPTFYFFSEYTPALLYCIALLVAVMLVFGFGLANTHHSSNGDDHVDSLPSESLDVAAIE